MEKKRTKTLCCKISHSVLQNPVITASGTFGYGRKAAEFFDINQLGGFVTKTLTLFPRQGNRPPRIYDLGLGVINSIGMQNPGLAAFKEKYSSFLNSLKTNVFISIYGEKSADWEKLITSLAPEKNTGFELNFSCPNIKGDIISEDKIYIRKLAARLRRATRKLLIAKLSFSPQIKNIALVLQDAGIDALTLINTLPAMAIDRKTHRPVLGNILGGLSGPVIKPVALRCVYELSRTVQIPVIGCGGIMNYHDALDFLSVGATAVEVGTATLIDRKSTRLNSSHTDISRMPSSA